MIEGGGEGDEEVMSLSFQDMNWWKVVWRKLEGSITEVWHMAHFWVSYGRCTMPGSPMGRSEGLPRCWAG